MKVFTVPCLEDYTDTVFVLREAEAGLKGPELVSTELAGDATLVLTFNKPIESNTIKRGDFRFFSNQEVAITAIKVDPVEKEKLQFTLSHSVAPVITYPYPISRATLREQTGVRCSPSVRKRSIIPFRIL